MEASPCVRIEKRKFSEIQEAKAFKNVECHESPNKARVVEKPSIVLKSSFQFGDERMIEQVSLECQSLEDSCLLAMERICRVVSFQDRVATFKADEFVVCMPCIHSSVACQISFKYLHFKAQVQTLRLSLPPMVCQHLKGLDIDIALE